MKTLPGLLVIIRHGESEWNAQGRWTGITNILLTEKGHREGELMGEKLQDLKFDIAYVSEQDRTLQTLQAAMRKHPQKELTHKVARAINERDYGKFTGKNKWEVKEEVGEDVFTAIRRGWEYPVPDGESLKMVYERVVPFFTDTVLPHLAKGENVLIAAHGNSIRSLMKYIENISDEDIAGVEMVFGTALLYRVDDSGHLADKEVRSIETELPPA